MAAGAVAGWTCHKASDRMMVLFKANFAPAARHCHPLGYVLNLKYLIEDFRQIFPATVFPQRRFVDRKAWTCGKPIAVCVCRR
jgi:hypothetical protein